MILEGQDWQFEILEGNDNVKVYPFSHKAFFLGRVGCAKVGVSGHRGSYGPMQHTIGQNPT